MLDPVKVTGDRGNYAVPDASTATKTSTPLIETPQSIQVLDRTLLDEQDRRTLFDTLVNVSGVTPAKTEETVLTQPIVRGFPAEIYIDGLPAYGGTPVIDPGSLVNVERVEVAKGPTAALYGGGIGAPLGGLINMVSKAPTAGFAATAALRAGSYATIDPSFDINAPLSADGSVLSRLTGEYQKANSYIDKVHSDRFSLYPTLSMKIDAQTDLTLRGQYSHIAQLEYSGIPSAITVAGPLLADPFHFSGAGDAPETTIDNKLLTLDLDHRFGTDLRGRLTARYYTSNFSEYGSFIYPAFFAPTGPTTYPLITGYLPTNTYETTLDGNLLGKASALGLTHELLAGATYDQTRYDAALGFNFNPIGIVDYANAGSDVPFGATPAVSTYQQDRYRNLAAYVQDQVSLGQSVHLLGALRYTRLDIYQADNALDQNYGKVTPRLGATVDIAPGAALFAGYSEGFRGTLNISSKGPPVPETSRSVEAGLKFALRPTGLSGSVAAFDLRRQKVPTPDPANLAEFIQTGEQRARGFEFDGVWEPTRALSVLANYAYTLAAVTQDSSIPIGDGLPRVPRNSGRLAVHYRFLGGAFDGFSAGAGVTGVSGRQITLPNTDRVPGYLVADAQLAYAVDRVQFALSIVNLTGVRAFDPYTYLAQPVVIPIQARSAFATVGVHF